MKLEIILVWLCQPITSLRNEELELPSLIIDNTPIQLSAVKPKLWVPTSKKVKCFRYLDYGLFHKVCACDNNQQTGSHCLCQS